MIDWLRELLRKKKSYITAAVVGIMAALEALGYVIPGYVYTILAAIGITTLRAGMTNR